MKPRTMCAREVNTTLLRRIGRSIAYARADRGWTQEALAAVLDISVKNVQRLECGRHDLRLSTVDRVASALGMTLDELVAVRPLDPGPRAGRSDGPWAGLTATGWRLLRQPDDEVAAVPVVDLRPDPTYTSWMPRPIGQAVPRLKAQVRVKGFFLGRANCTVQTPLLAAGAWCLFRHALERDYAADLVLVHRGSKGDWCIVPRSEVNVGAASRPSGGQNDGVAAHVVAEIVQVWSAGVASQGLTDGRAAGKRRYVTSDP